MTLEVFTEQDVNDVPFLNDDLIGRSKLCARYADHNAELVDHLAKEIANEYSGVDKLNDKQIKDLRGFLNSLADITSIRARDSEWNEVKMVDVEKYENYGDEDEDGIPEGFNLISVGAFPEFLGDMGFAECIFKPGRAGCISPLEEENFKISVDIFLNQKELGDDLPAIPHVQFNRCKDTAYHLAYETLVHESGHVFGLNHPRQGLYDRSDTVMSYKSGVRCSPNPLDIVVLHALYQSR